MFGWFKTNRDPSSKNERDVLAVISACDLERAEELRGTLTSHEIAEITGRYHELRDWEPKDVAVHLLQDCNPQQLREVMRDALRSPTAATRAVAFCSLSNDFGLFDSFLRDGIIAAELVDRAIRERFGTAD